VDTAGPAVPARVRGLTSAEVAERVAAGQTNDVPRGPSRTTARIVVSNTFTVFNALIGVLWVLIMAFGDWRDGLFGLVVVANTGIGIVQELRAKATLDRLSVVSDTRPRVRRDGRLVDVALAEVVLDDVLVLATGDRVVVDGEVVDARGLEVDESLLTGEADPVHKQVGDEVRSGSFVVSGEGSFVATRVGREAYAAQLAEEARRYTLVRSDLRTGINRILTWMSALMVPVGILLVWSQFRVDTSVADAVSGAVAGLVTMIPEGLVLLTSIAFAVGVVRLGNQQVLVQELPAIEGLARVDVICLDKTGTLTEPGMTLVSVEPLDTTVPVDAVLRALCASDPAPNPSMAAVAERYPPPYDDAWRATGTVPFSSARKWSGADLGEHGSYVIGAPEVLLDAPDPVRGRVRELAGEGLRVLVVGSAAAPLQHDRRPRIRPLALLAIEQRVKPDAARTLHYFEEQGVAVKVVSGDSPVTVGAVTERLGLTGATPDGVDAQTLPEPLPELADVVEREVAFGRVSPQQKQQLVRALQSRGHTVAMTGDGVNDVLALKDADIGIAMASGSDATRAVAQLVLVDNRFEHMPSVVAEGRRVIGNIERVANLFLSKTVYASALAVLSGLLALPFPFLPRHLTVVSALTIGVPGFFLALAPNSELARPGFVRRVLRFAVPAGLVCAGASFGSYYLAFVDPDVGQMESRSLAAITLFTVAWWVVVMIARPLNAWRVALVLSMVGAFLLVLTVPWLRHFFAFSVPSTADAVVAVLVGIAGIAVLEVLWWVMGRLDVDTSAHRPRTA
jgi:cation-transporting ATPase E